MMSISKLLVAIIAAFGAFALIAEPNAAYTENTTVDAALELDGEYIIDVASGVTVTYSGEISGTGPLRKTGAGTLVLANGNNTFTEGVQITQGYVRADAAGCLGEGLIHLSGTAVRQINFNADGAVFNNDILFEGKDPQSYSNTGAFIYTKVNTTLTGSVEVRNVEFVGNDRKFAISCGESDNKYPNARLVFKEGLSWPGGYLRCSAYSGTICFDGPLIVSTYNVGYNYGLKGSVEFNSTGNKIGTLSLSGANIKMGAAEAFAEGVPVFTLSRVDEKISSRSSLNLNGCNQTLTVLDFNNSYATKGNYGHITSVDPAILRLKGRSDPATSYQLISGKISLVVDAVDNPSFVQTLKSRAHTMSGILSVSNGTLKASGSTFKNAGEVHVGEGGKFIAETATAHSGMFAAVTNIVIDGSMEFGANITSPFTDDVADMSLGANSSLTMPDTMVLRVKTLTIDGKRVANKTKWGANGTVLDQLKGGTIVVDDGSAEIVNAEWTGEGSDLLIATAENWNLQTVPDFANLTVSANFASGGAEAQVDRKISLYGINLSAVNGFTFSKKSDSAAISLGEGGLATASPASESSPEYVFNVPLIPETALKFNVAADTVVKVNAGMNDLSGKQIVKEGDGELSIGGKSVVAGAIVHKKGTLRFSGEIGAPEGLNQGTPVQNGPSCITIPGGIEGLTTILDDVIFHKPVWMAGRGDVEDSTVNWLQFGAASTNVFKEKAILHTNVGYLNLDASSSLIFEKGVEFNSTVHFRNGELVVRGGKLSATTGSGFYLHGGSLRFETAGNAITLRGRSVRSVAFTVDYAITNHLFELDASYPQIYLNGTVQHCSELQGTVGVSLKGAYPSRFVVKKGSLYGKIEDGVSIEMNGDDIGVLYLGQFDASAKVVDHPSTGDLIATKGTLSLATKSLWRNGTNIVVRGTGKLKTSVSDQFNRNHTVVKLSDDGVLEIPEGVRQTVYDLYVNGVKVPGGMYGGADAPDSVNKTYAKHFTGKGVLRVVRHGMMTIVVR